MRIDNKSKPTRTESSKSSKKAGSARAGGKASAGAATSFGGGIQKLGAHDSVSISDHETTLDVIRSFVADAPDVRADMVEEIVGRLKNGKYKINFEKVAEGFIRDAIQNEVLKKRSRGQSRGQS